MLGFGFDLVGFPAATRYMRSPSAFCDVSVKPSFLRTTPAKKPRTECCCQPVAFIIAAIVTPLGCPRRARTTSCLVRLRPEGVSLPFAGLFTRCLARANLALVRFLRCDIWRIPFRLRRHPAPSPPKPRSGGIASGAGSARAKRPINGSDTDAPFATEVQSFLPFRFDGRLRDRQIDDEFELSRLFDPEILLASKRAASVLTFRIPIRSYAAIWCEKQSWLVMADSWRETLKLQEMLTRHAEFIRKVPMPRTSGG